MDNTDNLKDQNPYEEYLKNIRTILNANRYNHYSVFNSKAGKPVSEKIKKTKTDIQNEGLELDNTLKKHTLYSLFVLLGIETLVIFSFTFFQAIQRPWGFQLEEWSFKLLITATISQITAMLIIAVRYLFPKRGAD